MNEQFKKIAARDLAKHAFKPAKEFVHEVKKLQSAKPVEENFDDETEDSI